MSLYELSSLQEGGRGKAFLAVSRGGSCQERRSISKKGMHNLYFILITEASNIWRILLIPQNTWLMGHQAFARVDLEVFGCDALIAYVHVMEMCAKAKH